MRAFFVSNLKKEKTEQLKVEISFCDETIDLVRFVDFILNYEPEENKNENKKIEMKNPDN